jgi:secondary thiamine-phosphate synthase enzyme
MNVSEAAIRTNAYTLHVESTTAPEFIDISDRVAAIVEESGLRNGIVVVFSKHTTAAIIIQENEPLLLQDMASLIERSSPRNAHYRHNDFDVRTVHMHEDECPNGHSHCQHLSLGTSETIPVIDGKLAIGEFQRIFMVELDHIKALEVAYREVLVQTVGV